MISIGDRLRRERLRRGLDIDQLAELTKINAAMLEAIEADDLDRLPGSFFTRSFVRQYAKALELDDDEFESELKRVTGTEEEVPMEMPAPTPDLGLPPVTPGVGSYRRSHHSLSALAAFVLIVAACSGVYTLWQRARVSSATEARRSAAARRPAPAAAKPAVTPTAAPAVAQNETPAPTPPAPATGQPQETAPAPAAESQAPARTAETAAHPAETPAPASGTPAATPSEPGPVNVQVRTTAEAWVRVTADGANLYTGTLPPNESRSFDGKERVSILFGDPAAVEVTWNGKAVGAIGPQGKPRIVRFTPQAFRIFSPAPPTPPAPQPAP
jgi:cytoskeleton protein RodZ